MTLVRELSEAQLEEWKAFARRMGLVEMALLVDEVKRLRARVAELTAAADWVCMADSCDGTDAKSRVCMHCYGELLGQLSEAKARVAGLERELEVKRGQPYCPRPLTRCDDCGPSVWGEVEGAGG